MGIVINPFTGQLDITGAAAAPAPGGITVGDPVTGGTPNSVLIVDSAGNIDNTAALSNGQIIIGSTGAEPVAASLTTDATITATVGAGTLTLSIEDGDIGDAKLTNPKINLSEKGAPNGVATLDISGKVPVSQLPSSVFTYEGTWNAATNTPTLTNGTGDAGMVYITSVAGTADFGAGPINFIVGDWVIYNGTIWERSQNTNTVDSVNGQQGIVVLDTDDIAEGASNLYYTSARFDADFTTKSTTDLAEGANLYHTDERAQDAVGSILVDSPKIDFTYDDATPSITATIVPGSITDADIDPVTGIAFSKIVNGFGNVFAGFDSSGYGAPVVNWNVDTSTGHLNHYEIYNPGPDAGTVYDRLQKFELAITQTEDSADNNVTQAVLDVHFDRAGDGFSHDGQIYANSIFLAHEGSGYVGQMSANNTTIQVTGGGVLNSMAGIDHYINVQNNSTISSGRSFSTGVNIQAGSSLGQFVHNSAYMQNDGIVNGGHQFFNASLNAPSPVDATVDGYSFSVQPTSIVNQEVNAYRANISGDIDNFTAFKNNAAQGTFDNFGTTYTFLSDATVTNNVRASAFDMNNVTINGNLDGYQAQFGSNSTIDGNIYGFSVSDSNTADGFVGLNVQPSGNYDGAAGINLNMSGATVNGQRAMSINSDGGMMNHNTSMTIGNTGFDLGNLNTNTVIVPPGGAVATDVIAQNYASSIFAESDVTKGLLGLGVVGFGFVGQAAVNAGITVESFSSAVAAAAVPAQSTGGTIQEYQLFDAYGSVAQGGTLAIDNLYGLRVRDNFSPFALNKWGVSVEDITVKNFFAGGLDSNSPISTPSVVLKDGAETITINAPTLGGSYSLTLPTDDGATGQVLSTDGAGALSWISVTPSGDIPETSFTAAPNEITPVDITGFVFPNASIRSFQAQMSAHIEADVPLNEVFIITGVQLAGNWTIAMTNVGDNSEILLSITNAGQMQYTSTEPTGYVSSVFKFRALTTSI